MYFRSKCIAGWFSPYFRNGYSYFRKCWMVYFRSKCFVGRLSTLKRVFQRKSRSDLAFVALFEVKSRFLFSTGQTRLYVYFDQSATQALRYNRGSDHFNQSIHKRLIHTTAWVSITGETMVTATDMWPLSLQTRGTLSALQALGISLVENLDVTQHVSHSASVEGAFIGNSTPRRSCIWLWSRNTVITAWKQHSYE